MSDARVIEASRAFVCVRPLTYESAKEADYLRKMLTRRGGLENTVFAIMDPQSKTYLAQPDRMPYFAFPGCERDPNIAAVGMKKLAEPYKPTAEQPTLPTVANVRFALNVGACDRRPVAVIFGSETERSAAKAELTKLAWKPEFVGQFVFVESPDRPASLASMPEGARVAIVQPDAYGVKGTLLAVSTGEAANLASAMQVALGKFKPWTNDHRHHLRNGVKNGIRWKPQIPVEDAQANEATKRMWGG